MENILWKCDGDCKEDLDEYTYAMLISNVQVLEVDDKGRIAASSSTGQREQLCYSCYEEKCKEPAGYKAALMHCIKDIAHAIELIEAECYHGDLGALNELNELVVYIAGVLHPPKEEG